MIRTTTTSLQIHGYEVMLTDIKRQLTLWLGEQAYSHYFILVDENTSKHCLSKIAVPINHTIIEIKSGEENKNWNTCVYVWQQLLEHQCDRNGLLINLGGGVISDLGGFCAATFKRGIDWINIPTTLLAQVDATIGGKIGIDFEGQKNMLGLFQNPSAVFIDSSFLETLEERQMESGKAEMYKHGLISNAEHWEQLSSGKEIDDALILESMLLKKAIVEKDPFENGLRKILNFGHTLGHAFESLSFSKTHPYLHGEAVAWGMIAALYLSVKLNGMNADDGRNCWSFLKRSLPDFLFSQEDISELLHLCKNDKKNEGNVVKFCLLDAIGSCQFDIAVCEEDLIDAIKHCINL